MACTSGTSYPIQAGDTLYQLAQAKLGDGNRWDEITKPDGSSFTEEEARQLWVGQEVCIPSSLTSPTSLINEVLTAHNRYRAEVGVPLLQWSDALAGSAQRWANQLAAMNKLQHSQSGENLASGTTGSFSVTQLVEMWGNEKQHFISGTFPDVSNTGNWMDVGHYTQVVWRNTTEVGCGLASGGGNDFLVCHYNPPGNVTGQRVF